MKLNYICKFCGKVCIRRSGLAVHESRCKLNPERKPIQNYKCNWPGAKPKSDGWICRGCLRKLKTKRELFKHKKECDFYKALLANERKERGKEFSKKFKGTEMGKLRLGHPCSEENKAKMRDIAFRRHLGGWHTSRTIEYNGIKLDSEYELRVAKELDLNGIKWERPSYFLWTDDSGINHRYYPDFYLVEYKIYLDPKNDYLINNKSARFGITDREKISIVEKQNGIRILILDKDHLLWENIKKML